MHICNGHSSYSKEDVRHGLRSVGADGFLVTALLHDAALASREGACGGASLTVYACEPKRVLGYVGVDLVLRLDIDGVFEPYGEDTVGDPA